MKRILILILTLLTAAGIFAVPAYADTFDPESITTPYICLMDASSGVVLFEKNSREKAFPASTTKIMTCILALEMCQDVNETVNAGEVVETRGSLIHISRYEEMPLMDYLHGMMLESGNDAARAIAEHFAESESAFAELMTEKAHSIGMNDTHFVKSNGLHDDNHYTTAYDMALLARYAMKNETFRKIVSDETYDAAPTNKDSNGYHWENSNKLIHTKKDKDSLEYKYATGIKTGDTAYAGRCLVASAKKHDTELVLVLFGDYEDKVSGDYRFQNAAKLFDWAFDSYSSVSASELGLETTVQVPIQNAHADDPEGGTLTLDIDLSGLSFTCKKEDAEKIKADPSLLIQTKAIDKLTAPVTQGQNVGMISYQYNGATVFTASVYASRDVAEAGTQVVTNPAGKPPLIIDTEPNNTPEKNNSWVFWVCLAAGLIIIVVIANSIAGRRRRKRLAARRRKAYRSRLNK